MKYSSDVEAVDALAKAYKDLKAEIGKVIVGQQDVVNAVIISLFSNGHSLLVGVPGLAKTLLVSTIAQVLDLEFKRIQFTPDLMPSDVLRLGYTIGCPGCVWMQNKLGAKQGHNNHCRDSMEKALEEDDMGDGKGRSKL